MNYQLTGQWRKIEEISAQGDAARETVLMVEMAHLILRHCASRISLPAPSEQPGDALIEVFLLAQTLAEAYVPKVAQLGVSLADFKAEVAAYAAKVTQAREQLKSIQNQYDQVKEEHSSLERQIEDLRRQDAALAPLFSHYRELKALDERIKVELPKLAEDQAALIHLWPALAEACQHLQAQRDLLKSQFQVTGSIVESLSHESKLFGREPGPALELAIRAVADARDALGRLNEKLRAARREEQGKLDECRSRS